jgi:hypothetical protein
MKVTKMKEAKIRVTHSQEMIISLESACFTYMYTNIKLHVYSNRK